MTTDRPSNSSGPALFNHRAAARDSLHGLAVGDAFGAQFFVPDNLAALREHRLPPAPWPWTDDTEMACSIFDAHVGTEGIPSVWRDAVEPLPQWADADRPGTDLCSADRARLRPDGLTQARP